MEYNKGEINVVEKIEEAVRVLKPPYLEEYPYEAYEFANIKEIKNLVNEAESISIDSLYIRCKELVQEYNDQDPNKLVLIRTDILFSIFKTSLQLRITLA